MDMCATGGLAACLEYKSSFDEMRLDHLMLVSSKQHIETESGDFICPVLSYSPFFEGREAPMVDADAPVDIKPACLFKNSLERIDTIKDSHTC